MGSRRGDRHGGFLFREGPLDAEAFSRPGVPGSGPHFVLVRPFGSHGLGAAALEIGTGQITASENAPLDVFGNYSVAEVGPGLWGFYERGKGLQATASPK